MIWTDLTLPVRSDMAVWPGDPPVEIQSVVTVETDGVAVSRIVLGSHAGTHIDAPRHFLAHGGAVDEIEPDRLVGPCRVLDLVGVRDVIRASDLATFELRAGERVLLKTRNGSALLRGRFEQDYVALDESAAALLVETGVSLVGVDALSIETFDSPGHPVHHRLLERGVVIVEGLDLSKVEAGPGHLVALPLRLEGADGGPARVLLGR